jgi:hypothetical protein
LAGILHATILNNYKWEAEMSRKINLLALATSLLSLNVIVPSIAYPVTVTDGFNDGVINSSLWTNFVAGAPSVQETNGRLEITLPASSTNTSLEYFGAGYITANTITGDYSAQVDYQLLNWPTNNGVRIGISVTSLGSSIGSVQRNSDGNTYDGQNVGIENYSTFFPSLPVGSRLFLLTASSLTGSLGVERIGDIFNTYYKDGSTGTLTLFHSFNMTGVGDITLGLSAWSHDSFFSDQDVKIAFDNFTLEYGGHTPIPEPSTMLLLGSGLAGLVGFGRRRMKK